MAAGARTGVRQNTVYNDSVEANLFDAVANVLGHGAGFAPWPFFLRAPQAEAVTRMPRICPAWLVSAGRG